jgi:hypothetical protein
VGLDLPELEFGLPELNPVPLLVAVSGLTVSGGAFLASPAPPVVVPVPLDSELHRTCPRRSTPVRALRLHGARGFGVHQGWFGRIHPQGPFRAMSANRVGQ